MDFEEINQDHFRYLQYNSPLEIVESMLEDSTYEMDSYEEDYRETRNQKTAKKLVVLKQRVETLTEVYVRMLDFYGAKN